MVLAYASIIIVEGSGMPFDLRARQIKQKHQKP